MTRELDALIAEKVMGWDYRCFVDKPVEHLRDKYAWFNEDAGIAGEFVAGWDWSPSTSIASAWMVVEKMEGQVLLTRTIGGKWICEIIWGMEYTYQPEAPTAPLAICLAALKAVGYEGED